MELLQESRGTHMSGEEIAQRLSVTRAGIWKAVKALREEGYQIEAVTNRGYILQGGPDVLSAGGIERRLEANAGELTVYTVQTVDSTNTELKRRAAAGERRDLLLLAEEQTQGRGRIGRTFYSPPETGLYMSLLLHPQLHQTEGVLLTTAAAAAVAEAIDCISGEEAKIKWVNDIWVRDKKASGILTEAAASLEEGMLEYAVVGIGINVTPPSKGFPRELERVAGPVFEHAPDREELRVSLAAEVINRFMRYYRNIREKKFLDEYRRRSLVIGREIGVRGQQGEQRAKALAIDDCCRLKVRYTDGAEGYLSSGEVILV